MLLFHPHLPHLPHPPNRNSQGIKQLQHTTLNEVLSGSSTLPTPTTHHSPPVPHHSSSTTHPPPLILHHPPLILHHPSPSLRCGIAANKDPAPEFLIKSGCGIRCGLGVTSQPDFFENKRHNILIPKLLQNDGCGRCGRWGIFRIDIYI